MMTHALLAGGALPDYLAGCPTVKDDLGLDGIGPGCRPLGKVANAKPVIDFDGAVRAEFR
jgi:hypothetical protein